MGIVGMNPTLSSIATRLTDMISTEITIDIRKIKKLSWNPKFKLENKIYSVVEWYKKNYKQFL